MAAYLPTLGGFTKFVGITTSGLLVITAGVLFWGQTYLIYPSYVPSGSREIVSNPADFQMPYEDVVLKTADGTKVKAYLLKQKRTLVGTPDDSSHADNSDDEYARSRPTVLFFHANAGEESDKLHLAVFRLTIKLHKGNVGHRLPLARMFYNNIRCNVIMLSYRGYGHSEGTPTEKGIRLDAQATLDHILSHPLLGSTPLIFYGQSLGGAVAIDLASRNPDKVTSLILENTFTSIPAIAKRLVPLTRPFMFLCTEQWQSVRSIKRLRPSTQFLLLSGLKDELVPPAHMKELWSCIPTDKKGRKIWHEFPNGTHNDTCVQPGYWAKVKEFVESM